MSKIKYERENVLKILNVSRETTEKLDRYVKLLLSSQKTLNLISNNSVPTIWERHIMDSAQLVKHFPQKNLKILDVGTGGGFPGIVISILTKNKLFLMESSKKKCKFLQEVIDLIDLKAEVCCDRVEKLPFLKADIITVRAVASIDKLLKLLEKQIHKDASFFFFKGKNYKKELSFINEWPSLNFELIPSITDINASIIKINVK